MEFLIEKMSLLIAAVGALAFMVSVITQVIKGIGIFKKVPTDILVFVLSIVLSVVAFFAYMQYEGFVIIWYMIVAAIVGGFVVAFVAMFGWQKLSELWERFGKKKE